MKSLIIGCLSSNFAEDGDWVLDPATLLFSLAHKGSMRLLRPFLSLVSMAVELAFFEVERGENQLDGTIDNLGGKKWHMPAKDALALGAGPSNTGERSVNPEQNVDAASRFLGGQHINISVDASRGGGKDLMCGVLVGRLSGERGHVRLGASDGGRRQPTMCQGFPPGNSGKRGGPQLLSGAQCAHEYVGQAYTCAHRHCAFVYNSSG